MNSRQVSARAGRATKGFTLIELIVVISIIAILTTIGLMVGHHARRHSQETFTKDLIKSVDQAYSSFVHDKGAMSANYRDDQGNELAVADATVDGKTQIEPSFGLFVLATGPDPSIKEAILRADIKYLDNKPVTSQQTATPWTSVAVPVLKDAWGNPIRFVHPRYAGGYGDFLDATGNPVTRLALTPTTPFKRASGGPASVTFNRSYKPSPATLVSADEGLCSGTVGYFYSGGYDGDAGTRDNNVYLNVPKFPSETAKLTPLPAGS